MRYLFSDWEGIRKTLRGKFIYLFLDHDGTLAPITRTPDAAVMPKRTKDLLRQLSEMPDRKIAIVSGRALKDISERVGLKNIVYVGNHGFEIKGPKIDFKSPVSARYRRTLEEIKTGLEKSLSPFRGVIVEDKGFSLSVHYRSVNKGKIPAIKSEVSSVLFMHELKNEIKTGIGKMVSEVTPPVSWNKGKVVLWLLGRRLFAMRNKKKKVLPIYIGDDVTDEDAFESLKDKGMTIFVGKPGKTKAQFYLRDPGDVARFLKAILKV